MDAIFCFPSTSILMNKISEQTGFCKVPNKLESLSLSGSRWNQMSGRLGSYENVIVVSIWLVEMCPRELVILGCFPYQ